MQASLQLATDADATDDFYNGMTIVTGGDVVAVGEITDYTGSDNTFTATWSACDETGAVCDDSDHVTPIMTSSTTYTIGGGNGNTILANAAGEPGVEDEAAERP